MCADFIHYQSLMRENAAVAGGLRAIIGDEGRHSLIQQLEIT
jgi:hypothetical protein